METWNFKALPEELNTACLGLFDIAEGHGDTLQKRLIAASRMEGQDGDSERSSVDFAFLDSSKILSSRHIFSAVYAALLAAAAQTLRTATIHSEIIYNLTLSSNVGDGLRSFGVGKATRSLLLIHIPTTGRDAALVSRQMQDLAQAPFFPIDQLGQHASLAAVKKTYKLGADTALQDRRKVDDVVTSIVASKTAA